MSKKRVVGYQRRPKPLHAIRSSDGGVTRQLFARSKPNKAAPKKFHAEAPATRPEM